MRIDVLAPVEELVGHQGVGWQALILTGQHLVQVVHRGGEKHPEIVSGDHMIQPDEAKHSIKRGQHG